MAVVKNTKSCKKYMIIRVSLSNLLLNASLFSHNRNKTKNVTKTAANAVKRGTKDGILN